MKAWLKLLLLPWAFLAAAAGGGYWMVYGFWFGSDAQDRTRDNGLFGWLVPAMDPHFRRFAEEMAAARWYQWPHIIYENLKNLASEWDRLDAQRAVKLLCLVMLVLLLLLVWLVLK